MNRVQTYVVSYNADRVSSTTLDLLLKLRTQSDVLVFDPTRVFQDGKMFGKS